MSSIQQNTSESLFRSSLQFRSMEILTSFAWVVPLVAIGVLYFFIPDRDAEYFLLVCLSALYLLLRFLFLHVNSPLQFDGLTMVMLLAPMGIALYSYSLVNDHQIVAVMCILLMIGAILFHRELVFWSFLVTGISACYLTGYLCERPLSRLDFYFLCGLLPFLVVVIRLGAIKLFRDMREQRLERDQLIKQLTRSLKESQAQKNASELARMQLFRNEAKLDAILDRAPLILIVLDSDGVCTQCRGQALSAIGFTMEDVVGRRYDEIFSQEPEVVECISKARLGEKAQVRVELAQGLQHDLRFKPVFDSAGKVTILVGVSVEVSQQAIVESGRQANFERQMFYSQKMESLGMVAGAVAHDFNNYLAAIVSFSESMLATVDEEHRNAAEQIRRTALQAAGISEQMLAYSGKGDRWDNEPEPIELNSLLQNMVPFLQIVASNNVDLELQAEKKDVWMMGRELQIQQIIMNVTKNATQSMPEGKVGKIGLVVHGQLSPDWKSRWSVGELKIDEADCCCIEILDNGCGIADDVIEKIATPHFTTKEEGHGLGMVIAKRIVLDHNGRIEIEDNEPTGTRVRFIFAKSKDIPASGIPQTSESFSEPSIKRKILLVDDEPSVLESVSMLLRAKGNEVVAVQSAVEALDQMTSIHGEIDCLIIDFSMPEINGLELLNRIRAQGWMNPTILCSGYTMQLDDHPNAQFWPDAFLAKPYRFGQLQDKMEEVCRNFQDQAL